MPVVILLLPATAVAIKAAPLIYVSALAGFMGIFSYRYAAYRLVSLRGDMYK
jgi:hypothetical protein